MLESSGIPAPIAKAMTDKGYENLTPVQDLMNKAKEGLELRLRKFIYKKNINKSQDEIKIIYQDRLSHELDIINSIAEDKSSTYKNSLKGFPVPQISTVFKLLIFAKFSII